MPDISALADAWEAKDLSALAPYCEVVQIPGGGTRLEMDTVIHSAIQEELSARYEDRRRAKEEIAARAAGFNDVKHALAHLAEESKHPGVRNAAAYELYLRIFD